MCLLGYYNETWNSVLDMPIWDEEKPAAFIRARDAVITLGWKVA